MWVTKDDRFPSLLPATEADCFGQLQNIRRQSRRRDAGMLTERWQLTQYGRPVVETSTRSVRQWHVNITADHTVCQHSGTGADP